MLTSLFHHAKRFLIASSCLFFISSAYADLAMYVYPQQALVNKPISIRVSGVKPGTPVDLTATTTDELGRVWKSNAQVIANSAGMLALGEQAPISGTYLTPDSMGLFWSMQLPSDVKNRTLFAHSSLNPMIVNLTATNNGQTIKAQLTRYVAADGITRVSLPPETGLVGNLFTPKGKGPFPTVIVLGGLGGGIPSDAYAVQFANQGYAVIALAYYKAPGVPTHLSNIPLEYFGKAIQWAQIQPQLNTRRLAVVGTSFGGSTALLVAAHYPQIKAVAVFSGGGVIFQSVDPKPDVIGAQTPFTYGGKPLAYIPLDIPSPTAENLTTSYYLRTFLSSLFAIDPQTVNKATILVENIQGPILMQAGVNDLFLGSSVLSGMAFERLSEKHFAYDYQLINYNGVGHFLGGEGLPYTPTTVLTSPIGVNGGDVNLGGNPKDTADAQVKAWQAVMDFLAKYAR